MGAVDPATGILPFHARKIAFGLGLEGMNYGDMNAVVAWTAGMRVSVSTQVRVSRQVYAGASGESVALQFMGMQGHFVVVQPYEETYMQAARQSG